VNADALHPVPPTAIADCTADAGAAMATTKLHILRLPDVIRTTGVGRDTIYRLIRDGAFPAQRRISGRSSGWRSDEVEAWIESRPVSKIRSPNAKPAPGKPRSTP
jgi:prophage regulatory protein